MIGSQTWRFWKMFVKTAPGRHYKVEGGTRP